MPGSSQTDEAVRKKVEVSHLLASTAAKAKMRGGIVIRKPSCVVPTIDLACSWSVLAGDFQTTIRAANSLPEGHATQFVEAKKGIQILSWFPRS